MSIYKTLICHPGRQAGNRLYVITPYEGRELDKPFSADATMPAFQPRQVPGDPSVLECHGYTVDSVSSFSDFLTDDTIKALLAVVETPFDTETLGKLDVLIRVYVHFSQISNFANVLLKLIPPSTDPQIPGLRKLYGASQWPTKTWLAPSSRTSNVQRLNPGAAIKVCSTSSRPGNH